MHNRQELTSAQASFEERPVWLPAHTIRLYCGRDFEVLRCNVEQAEQVLAVIGPVCGPVITSALGYSDFLLPPGEHFREAVPRAAGVRMMPQGTQIDVPPLTAVSTEGLYWRVRPGVGFTRLAAVTAALRPPVPPRHRAGGPAARRAPAARSPGCPGGGRPVDRVPPPFRSALSRTDRPKESVMPAAEAPSSSTKPDTEEDKLVFFTPAQGWGQLESGTFVFDDGGQLGPDGEVVPAIHERVSW